MQRHRGKQQSQQGHVGRTPARCLHEQRGKSCSCPRIGKLGTVTVLGDTSPNWAPTNAFVPSMGAAELEAPREAVGTREPPCSLLPAPVLCALQAQRLHPCSFRPGSLRGWTALTAVAGLAAQQSCMASARWCDVLALRHHHMQLSELRGCPRLTCVCSGTHGPLSGDFSLLV